MKIRVNKLLRKLNVSLGDLCDVIGKDALSPNDKLVIKTQQEIDEEGLEDIVEPCNLDIYELIEIKEKMEKLIEERYFELGRKIGHNMCTCQDQYPEEHMDLNNPLDVLADLKRKMEGK